MRRAVLWSFLVLVPLALAAQAPDRIEGDRPDAIFERLLAQAHAAVKEGKTPAVSLAVDGIAPSEVLSWSWGATNSGATSGGGGGAGKVTFQDFHFVKKIDAASQELFRGCAAGKHYPSATVDVRNEKGVPYMKIVFKDVLISSYQTGGSGGEVMESVSLVFAQVDYFILIGL